MINFMVTDACMAGLGVFYFIRELLKMAYIVIPIGLIVMLALDFSKGVFSLDNSSKALSYALRRILYTLAIFLIPTVVFGVMTAIGLNFEDSNSCWAYLGKASFAEVREAIKTQNDKFDEEEITTNETVKKILENYNALSEGRKIASTKSKKSSKKKAKIRLDLNNISKTSNVTAEQLKKAMNSSSSFKKVSKYASKYVEAENDYSVNIIFLIGLEAHESGRFSSSASRDCNNFGGVVATANSKKCRGHKYTKFSSPEAFIRYHAKLIKDKYIENDKKSLSAIKPIYCGTGSDCNDWESCTKKFSKELKSLLTK